MDVHEAVLAAESRIRPYIIETPIEHSPLLSQMTGADVWLKMEHMQTTGSFKLRGATNKVLSLSPEAKEKGVITASTGNHGSAFAYIADKLNCKGTIFLPENVAATKVEMMKQYAVKLIYYGQDSVDAENMARDTAMRQGQTFISPYNDPEIIGGQGTIGLELERQLDKIDSILVPVGGGGLISGIAGYLKTVRPWIEAIGCQPQNSPVMYESIKAGHIVDMESLPTLSDGTAGGLEPHSITFDLCQQWVDQYVVVTEDEIREALIFLLSKHYLLVEGAAAMTVASLLKQKSWFAGKTVVLVLCGRKMGLETLRQVLQA